MNIRNYNPVTGETGYCIAVARASVAIYFALCGEKFPSNKKVIVPANLCYAGIYPVVYAGLQPVFCDVDSLSGNVTAENIISTWDEDVVATIIPHMYGNPVKELPEIAMYCKQKGILLIEDCASAMGATASNYSLGCMGDYVIYSTGYSKTLDLGFGGFLFSSKRDLAFTEVLEKQLPDFCEENERNASFFSKLYRLIRNEGAGTEIENMIYKGLVQCCKGDFLHKINDEKKEWLFQQLNQLPEIIKERQNALKFYKDKTRDIQTVHYNYEQGATPWRFNILVDGNVRRELIRACLEESLPISDWYPQVTKLFGIIQDYPGAKKHEELILNFPLLIEDEKKERICKILHRYLDIDNEGVKI